MLGTPKGVWCNWDGFFSGAGAIVEFLSKKWGGESGYQKRVVRFCW